MFLTSDNATFKNILTLANSYFINSIWHLTSKYLSTQKCDLFSNDKSKLSSIQIALIRLIQVCRVIIGVN